MSMYEEELAKAQELLKASGHDPDDFAFDMEFMEPDPDGGGMFTVQYEVKATNAKTGKSLRSIGGIGSDWVGRFKAKLDEGHFD